MVQMKLMSTDDVQCHSIDIGTDGCCADGQTYGTNIDRVDIGQVGESGPCGRTVRTRSYDAYRVPSE